MLKFSCLMTGDDYKMLMADTPESRKKVNALATVLFIPVIIWFVNGFLMVKTILEGSLSTSLIVGFVLAFLIFLIEKNLIMAHVNRPIKIFRYSLGIIIALLGAVVLDEVIFKADVDQELYQLNKEVVEKNLNQIDDTYRPDLAELQQIISQKYDVWQQALNDVKNEADGSSGSGIKGVHAITILKMNTAEIFKADYEQSKESLATLEQTIENRKKEQQQLIEASFNSGAMLVRIKAMFRLIFSDWAMGIIYFLFTAFLFFMEFLVVFLKSAWPVTNYERRLILIEEIGKRRMEKLLANDHKQYDYAQAYPTFSSKKNEIKSTHAMFN